MAEKIWISASSTDFQSAGNWSDGKAPASGDTLHFNAASTIKVQTNLANSSLTGVTLVVESSYYPGEIGTVAAGAATPLYLGAGATLKMPATTGGGGSFAGPPRVLVKADSAGSAVIENTNPIATDQQFPSVELTGTWDSVTVTGGNIGISPRSGDTAAVTALNVSRGVVSDPLVYVGPGATVTSESCSGGTIRDYSSNTVGTLRTSQIGVVEVYGSGAHTSVYNDLGTLRWYGGGTITLLSAASLADFSGCPGLTITDCVCRRGYKMNVDNAKPGSIVFTNPIQFPDGVQAGSLQTPNSVKASLAAI